MLDLSLSTNVGCSLVIHTNTHIHESIKHLNERLSVIDQHYVLIVSPLFDTQAATCFGSHVPCSGSFLCPYELLEGRNGYVVCHVL
jgi:N-dimethylarginine dimethylaminohydrolase